MASKFGWGCTHDSQAHRHKHYSYGPTVTKTQKLEAALKWALENGAEWSTYGKYMRNSGCGCCSGSLDIPEEFRDVVMAAVTPDNGEVPRG